MMHNATRVRAMVAITTRTQRFCALVWQAQLSKGKIENRPTTHRNPRKRPKRILEEFELAQQLLAGFPRFLLRSGAAYSFALRSLSPFSFGPWLARGSPRVH